MFRRCAAAQAEVELYAINNAPAQLTRTIAGRAARPARGGRPAVAAVPPRTVNYANARARKLNPTWPCPKQHDSG